MSKPESRFVGNTELPWPTGMHVGPDVRLEDINADYKNGKWSLTGLSKEYRLYSAAVLAFMGLTKDPVAIYWTENNLPQQETPYVIELNKEILKGLPEPFNRIVFACPRQYSDGLIRFLDRLATIQNRNVDSTINSIRQQIQIVDWKLLESISVAPVKPPTVTVDLYGLERKDGVLVWSPPQNLYKDPIQLVFKQKINKKSKEK